jgi:magnesium-protoporphyrin O-methyltransferase
MAEASYQVRRSEIETYFDRTALKAWEQLTSAAPVGRIRATVRAGRDRMRAQLLAWLPHDMSGLRLLDAGCGTGALAQAAAERGADVLAIDLSPSLVELARQRFEAIPSAQRPRGRIEFRSGDMLDDSLGRFDHVVAMDSLIHYGTGDSVRVLHGLSQRTRTSILFTFAPSNPALATMRAVGRLFPRGNRAPWIEPVAESKLHRLLDDKLGAAEWQRGRTQRVASGFYTSQALELKRP